MEINIEKIMGKQRLVDKSIQPMATVQNITPANFTIARQTPAYGAIVMGDYRGAARFLDLDKLVVQPLVLAEQLHILGILDGREEDYDLQTLATVAAEAIGTAHTATLTVPSGEVWIINAVEMVVPASGGANAITANWMCSLWTDRAATPNTNGQPFLAAAYNPGVGGGTQWDEFGVIPLLWAATNKGSALRLPAGESVSVTFTNTLAVAAAAVNCLFRIYGFIGKTLVA